MAIVKHLVLNEIKSLARPVSVKAADPNNPKKNDWKQVISMIFEMLDLSKASKFDESASKFDPILSRVKLIDSTGEIAKTFEETRERLRNNGFFDA